MLFQVDALKQVDAFLRDHGIPYAIIGGIANAVRGEPRATHDADLKVLVAEALEKPELLTRFDTLYANA